MQGSILLCMCCTQDGIERLSGQGAWRQRLSWNIFDLKSGVLQQQMAYCCPTEVSAQRCQASVNGSRGGTINSLAICLPIAQVFVAQQRRIEGASSSVLPPRDKMGKILAHNFESARGASFDAQALQVLLD